MSNEFKNQPDPNAFRGSLDEYTVQKYTGIRRMIGENLKGSAQNAPHVYQGVYVNMENCVKLRKQVNEQYKDKGIKVSYIDIIAVCLAEALKLHPDNNAALIGNEIRKYKSINIGIATDTERGLVVPVVKDAGNMSLIEFSETSKRLCQRARDGLRTMEEFHDGTVTISNMGAYGLDWITSIINPPQTSIISVPAIKDRPTVINGEIVIKPIMFLTFADDHRTVDGVTNGKFIQTFHRFLEDPEPVVRVE